MISRSPVTLRDIAERAGVSHMTVSNVLNRVGCEGKTSKRVAARIRRIATSLNYAPNPAARALRGNRTGLVALLTTSGLTYYHVTGLVEEIHLALGTRGYQGVLIWLHRSPDVQRACQTLVSTRYDGALVLGNPLPQVRDIMENANRSQMPVLLVGTEPHPRFTSVDSDRVEEVRLGVDHFLQQGHRRVAIVCDYVGDYARQQRLAGYRAALQSHGVAFDPRLVFPWAVEGTDPEELWRRIAAVRPHPTAVFCYNDRLCAAFLRTIRAHGLRVPEDVALVTLNNSPLTTLVDVPLTAVEAGHREIAEAVLAEFQEQLIHPHRPSRSVKIQPHIVLRQSSDATAARAQFRNEIPMAANKL